ncbi:MAG: PEGA domain-containing protein [Candidatus Methanofastidiosia archaeon]
MRWSILILAMLFISLFQADILSQDFLKEEDDLNQQELIISVWVDKGCGANYKLSEKLTVHLESNFEILYNIRIAMPNGKRRFLVKNALMGAGHSSRGTYIDDFVREELYGEYRVIVDATAIGVGEAYDDHCVFFVVRDEPEVPPPSPPPEPEQPGEGELKVEVLDQDLQPLPNADIFIDGTYAGVTSFDGIFYSEKLKEGTYLVEVRVRGASQRQTVKVRALKVATIVLQVKIQKSGNLELNVMDNKGNSLSGADVYLDEKYVGKTSPSGNLLIEDLEEGVHSLSVTKSGYETFKGSVSVIPSKTQTQDVRLNAKFNYLLYGGIALFGVLLLLLIFLVLSTRKREEVVYEKKPVYAGKEPIKGKKKKKLKVEEKVVPRKGKVVPLVEGKAATKLCKICEGFLDKPGDKFTCPRCEQTYHIECARRTELCPLCGERLEVK